MTEFQVGDRVKVGQLSGRPYGDSQDGKLGIVENIGWDKEPKSLADKIRVELDDGGIIWVGPNELTRLDEGEAS